jgi:hypothetical protein
VGKGPTREQRHPLSNMLDQFVDAPRKLNDLSLPLHFELNRIVPGCCMIHGLPKAHQGLSSVDTYICLSVEDRTSTS